MKSELRKDYIQEKYVIIAPRRNKRPRDTYKNNNGNQPDRQKCVFCPHNLKGVEPLLTHGDQNNWTLKVIKNIYPAISLDNPRAYGQQEVVIETPDHQVDLHELPVTAIADIFQAYAERTIDISRNKKIEYILTFKNQGAEAGASLHHAHSQIFATSFLPPHLFDKSQRIQAYKLEHGTCVYCDVAKKESRGPRLVHKDENLIAFTPYASMMNHEVWIMPWRHIDNITLLNQKEIDSFAKILKKILKKIQELNLSYNYYFHQVVFDSDQHLYLKIKPRGSTWAGVEIGSGIIINPVSPEEAANYYRQP